MSMFEKQEAAVEAQRAARHTAHRQSARPKSPISHPFSSELSQEITRRLGADRPPPTEEGVTTTAFRDARRFRSARSKISRPD